MATPNARKYRLTILAIVLAVAGLWAGAAATSLTPRLGLDLQGGISVVLAPKTPAADPGALDKAIDIIRNRVDALGVAEPEISRQGENVLVQLPGIKEQERALELIGTTAKLRMRPVLERFLPVTDQYDEVGPADCGDSSTYPPDEPDAEIVLCVRERAPDGSVLPEDQWTKLRLGPVRVAGEDIAGARATLQTAGPTGAFAGWTVDLDLTSEGARKFQEVTGELACNRDRPPRDQLAIVLDRVVESHPQMGEGVECNRGITGGTAQITGNFDEPEARDLGLILQYGALPVELEPISTSTVSPTLGRDSLRAGLLAGAVGLGVVFVYVLLFYRALGAVVWLGLALHGGLTIGIVIYLSELAGFALTLAGIAGLIVSIGVATDSFIVYLERIKDEVRRGTPIRRGVERAWESARRTIIAADLVTAMAAAVLYVLAVGGVRGFALMLGIATALDVLISFWVMHPLVWLLAQRGWLDGSRALGAGAREPAPAAAGGGS